MFLALKVRHSFLLLLALFAGALFRAQPIFGDTLVTPNIYRDCSELFSRLSYKEQAYLNERFLKFSYEPMRAQAGFVLRRQDLGIVNSNGLSIVTIHPDPTDGAILSKSYWKDLWKVGDQKYEFINVGYKIFEPYSERVNYAVLEHMLKYPDKDLMVHYDSFRQVSGQRLRPLRWALHDAVMRAYLKRKGYLTLENIKTLIEVNNRTSNSDVFALLRDDPKSSILDLTQKEIQARAVYTLQITYFGDRSFLRPTAREMILATNTPLFDVADKLPFEYRIDPSVYQEFREQFYKDFRSDETAEILRCALFDSSLPQGARDLFILNALQTAASRGTKNIIISVDKYTSRLFRRYGFRKYRKLPTTLSTEEYIFVLKADSSDYIRTLQKLGQSSTVVQEITEEL